jgi:hypothetical protein
MMMNTMMTPRIPAPILSQKSFGIFWSLSRVVSAAKKRWVTMFVTFSVTMAAGTVEPKEKPEDSRF